MCRKIYNIIICITKKIGDRKMALHLFIINPKAGSKDRYSKLSEIIKNLKIKGEVFIERTEHRGHAAKIVSEYLRRSTEFLRIYSCGGDGTLSEVVSGVHASENKNCAIGVVPIGSGNDFIKNFSDYKKDDFLSLSKMCEGECIPADVIEVSDADTKAVSINIVSAGFDAAAAKGMSKFKRIPLIRKFSYELSLVECLFTKRKHRFKLIADGVEVEDGTHDHLFALAANGTYYGGGYKASPLSDLSDGYMDFIRIKTVGLIRFLKLVGIYRKGEHLSVTDIVEWQRCKELQFIKDEYIDMNLDGEIIPMKNPTIKIIDDAVKVILPAVKTAATV